MAQAQGPLSGFRDLLADKMIPLQGMLSTIQRVYESYGFLPLSTPALERYETLKGKYGTEGEKLIYKFEDQGGRMVALRYDLTVPLSRVVAQYQTNLPMPYKRYAIGPVWRGERPQAGRYREFIQFDADIVGSDSPAADAEILAMMADAIRALGAKAIIKVNNRLLLDALVEKAGLAKNKDSQKFITLLDKIEKIGLEPALNGIAKAFGQKVSKSAESYLYVEGDVKAKLGQLADLLSGAKTTKAGIVNLEVVFDALRTAGYGEEEIIFDQSIARGLDYYTGIIFETFLEGAEKIGSVASGGRYDRLIKKMGGPDLPAVGTSFGVDRLFDGLRQLGQLKPAKTTSQVLVVNFDEGYIADYLKLATDLRRRGIATEIYYQPAKLAKQIGYADKMGIPLVVLMGPDEFQQNKAVIKTLSDGKQTTVPVGQLVAKLKSSLK